MKKFGLSTKDLTRCALLGAILFAVFYIGSMSIYGDMASFIMLLYGVYLDIKKAWLSVLVFCLLVMACYGGVASWTIMYLLIFPQYMFIYNFVAKKTKSEYVYAIVGFFLAAICGTIIGLPYTLTAGMHGKALLIYLTQGFMVDLVTGLLTFLATLFFAKPLGKILRRLDNM